MHNMDHQYQLFHHLVPNLKIAPFKTNIGVRQGPIDRDVRATRAIIA